MNIKLGATFLEFMLSVLVYCSNVLCLQFYSFWSLVTLTKHTTHEHITVLAYEQTGTCANTHPHAFAAVVQTIICHPHVKHTITHTQTKKIIKNKCTQAYKLGGACTSIHAHAFTEIRIPTSLHHADTEGSFIVERVADIAECTVQHLTKVAESSGEQGRSMLVTHLHGNSA